jgi:pantoate--beta-alanine ligase
MFETVSVLRTAIRAARNEGRSVGFVPTMGALHEGHLSLMRRARAECDFVVVSIFVNPTQFGPGEDFARYPRDLAKDSGLIQKLGVDAIFAPSTEVLYPAGSQTYVEVPEIAARLEGAFRPGHFRGVATVCAKLFQVVQPDRAYFGMKDLQQVRVVQRMVTDLLLPVTVVPCPTVRDVDGLALSSRNGYLGAPERAAATVLSRALRACEAAFAGGELSAHALEQVLAEELGREPLARVDYAVVVDASTLDPVERVCSPAAAVLAVHIGATRLIDNALLEADCTPDTGRHSRV